MQTTVHKPNDLGLHFVLSIIFTFLVQFLVVLVMKMGFAMPEDVFVNISLMSLPISMIVGTIISAIIFNRKYYLENKTRAVAKASAVMLILAFIYFCIVALTTVLLPKVVGAFILAVVMFFIFSQYVLREKHFDNI